MGHVVAANASALYERAASLLPMGAWSCDLTTQRLTWTDGVFDLFGLSKDEVPAREAALALYDDASREQLERKRSDAIRQRAGFSLDALIVRHDGTERWIRITAATQRARGSETLYGMKQDVTEEVLRWQRLKAQAECDPLTGLANRAPFQRFLDGEDARSPTALGALLLLDMDGFKLVNDWWGHAAGDACLAAFAARLKAAFPGAELISRIGGDEFAVLLRPGQVGANTAATVRSRLAALASPVAWNGDMLPIGVSAGLAFAHEHPELEPHELFVAADRALYNAKDSDTNLLVCA